MVQEVTTARIGLIDSYANTFTPLSKSSSPNKSHRIQPFITTPVPAILFTTEESSAEQINEAVLQESFDKLSKVRNSLHQTKFKHKQTNSENPSITFDFVKTKIPNNHFDISSNKLDVNNTNDVDLHGEDLDENFTLVDLQRSRINTLNSKSFRRGGSKNFNDNILGTIGN